MLLCGFLITPERKGLIKQGDFYINYSFLSKN